MKSLLSLLDARMASAQVVSQAERNALAWLHEHGAPTRKHEDWRFTPIREELSAEWTLPTTSHDANIQSQGLVFSNGELLGTPPQGATLIDAEPLPAFDDNHIVFADRLSQASSREYQLEIGEISEPLHIRYSAEGAGALYASRLTIVVAPHQSVTVVEEFDGHTQAFSVNNTRIEVGENASVEHIRIHACHGPMLSSVQVQQQSSSRYRALTSTFGGVKTRVDHHIRFVGSGAEAHLLGAYQSAENEHVDHHLRADHLVPHCHSEMRYFGTASGKSTCVFDAQAIIHRDAKGSEAHQENRNLLLSEKAKVHTKPHLEIDNDEVSCSHGSTVGSLDDEQLFYMRSRGIREHVAASILTEAFLRRAIDPISVESARERALTEMVKRFPQDK